VQLIDQGAIIQARRSLYRWASLCSALPIYVKSYIRFQAFCGYSISFL